MLTIRREQMEVFGRQARREYCRTLVRRLWGLFPEECERLGRDAVEEQVSRAVDRAADYGIRSEAETAEFVDLDFRLGAEFELQPEWEWAREILEARVLSTSDRLYRLFDRLEERGVGIYA